MDLPMGSDKVGNIHCPSHLTVYYFYCCGRKLTSFPTEESEIFPKTFLGLIYSRSLWAMDVMKVSVFSCNMT